MAIVTNSEMSISLSWIVGVHFMQK